MQFLCPNDLTLVVTMRPLTYHQFFVFSEGHTPRSRFFLFSCATHPPCPPPAHTLLTFYMNPTGQHGLRASCHFSFFYFLDKLLIVHPARRSRPSIRRSTPISHVAHPLPPGSGFPRPPHPFVFRINSFPLNNHRRRPTRNPISLLQQCFVLESPAQSSFIPDPKHPLYLSFLHLPFTLLPFISFVFVVVFLPRDSTPAIT